MARSGHLTLGMESHVRSFDHENRDDENDRESGRQRLDTSSLSGFSLGS